MSRGIYLAFDFGLKRIGTAVGQSITQKATPLVLINAKEGTPDWDAIQKLIQEWKPEALIVGIPKMMDGTPQPITEQALTFVEQLQQHFSLPVFEVDERLSTKAAREQIFNAGGSKALRQVSVDCIAAQVILEQWLSKQTPT